jgi:hypothetical protein
MRLCGKRLFTPACKASDRGLEAKAVRRLPGRFFCFEEDFLFLWWRGCFSRGFWEKGVFGCGDFVVKVWWIAW